MLELIDDAGKLDLLAGVLLAILGARRHEHFELLPLGAVEQDVHVLLSQVFEGRVQTEAAMRGETVKLPPSPAIGVVAHCGIDERSLVETTLWIGHEKRRMHAHGRPDSRAGWASTGRIVEGELDLLHLACHQAMAVASKAVVELLQGRVTRLSPEDVKAKQTVAEFEDRKSTRLNS